MIIVTKATVVAANNRHELVFLQRLLWSVEYKHNLSLYRKERDAKLLWHEPYSLFCSVFRFTEYSSLTPIMFCYVLCFHFASKPAGVMGVRTHLFKDIIPMLYIWFHLLPMDQRPEPATDWRPVASSWGIKVQVHLRSSGQRIKWERHW